MRAVGHEKSGRGFDVRDAEFVEHFLRRAPERHLVHQIATDPEPAAEVVVALNDQGFYAGLRQFTSSHQAGGSCADNDAVALHKFLELS